MSSFTTAVAGFDFFEAATTTEMATMVAADQVDEAQLGLFAEALEEGGVQDAAFLEALSAYRKLQGQPQARAMLRSTTVRLLADPLRSRYAEIVRTHLARKYKMTFRVVDPQQDGELLWRFSLYNQRYVPRNGFPPKDRFLENLARRVQNEPKGQLLLFRGNRVVGYLSLETVRLRGKTGEKIGRISAIYILPKMRGRGIGRALLKYADGYFRRRGIFEIYLKVFAGNPAISLYERHGFRTVGSEPFGSLRVSQYVMVKNLSPTSD